VVLVVVGKCHHRQQHGKIYGNG